MGEVTAISWCEHTFNAWWGCEKVSPACTRCYAEAMSKRIGGSPWAKGPHWGPSSMRTPTSEKMWSEPLKWNSAAIRDGARRRVFCASMADVFEDRDDLLDARARLYGLVDNTPQLDWLLLTKRPENADRLWFRSHVIADRGARKLTGHWQRNVWLGATIEDNKRKEERLLHLIASGARTTFVSYEPALEFVDFTDSGVDLVIIGGESGHGAREFSGEWAARNIYGRGVRGANSPAMFVKQLGANLMGQGRAPAGDPARTDIASFPPHLQVRESPEARR